MADDDLVTIARFENAVEAHEARIELEAHGIDSLVADQTAADQAFPGLINLGGARLQVRQSDVDEALRILRDTPAGDDLEVDAQDEPPEEPDQT